MMMNSKNHNREVSIRPFKYFQQCKGRITPEENTQEWNNSVEFSDIVIGKMFSYGAYSKIYKGAYKEHNVAVKIVNVANEDETLKSLLEKQVINEAVMLSRIHHQNVVKMIGAYRDSRIYCILTEYQREGTLRSYLRKEKPISLRKVITFGIEIAHGMEYIHSKGIIHRNLKPESVLIGDDSHLKIADFGIACEASKCDSMKGTFHWMAPEMMKGKPYGRKVDVYSFGLILLEMFTGKLSFNDITQFEVARSHVKPVIPSNCPHVLANLIRNCCDFNPDRRPEFGKVINILEQFQHSSIVSNNGKLSIACHHKKGLHIVSKNLFMTPFGKTNSFPDKSLYYKRPEFGKVNNIVSKNLFMTPFGKSNSFSDKSL